MDSRKRLFIIIGCSILIVAVLIFFLIKKDETAPSFFECGDKIIYQGDTYKTIQIGEQCWMKENLKTTKYRDGTPITNFKTNARWSNDTAGAYACYQNIEENCSNFGALYNWYAVNNPAGLCPAGWSVPTNNQWLDMEKSVCQSLGHDNCQAEFAYDSLAGFKGTDEANHLKSKTFQGSDTFGFSAFLYGFRNPNGPFSYFEEKGFWWTSTFSGEFAYGRMMDAENQKVRQLESMKSSGFSVRCIKD
ncbi:MAG: hypothetical protein A2Z68_00890 [Candidatus Nealsonbacteria bacterium RBG_13_38_11]|uniref:Fibrobacter succinogenes major paralogous domain-containing protein n=1 Tax=Candidatus Nealsonbacteria bacterium RBG_13_38_11 TaxID=1801662 RepID=A0A1G2DY91_9BACT|nr:MAG: hypothetical protein A2Z68_00890 [Candidatus Nealsonbacteria bacterium RBG_13_38_11]